VKESVLSSSDSSRENLYVIRNEDDAFGLLASALNNEVDQPDEVMVRFVGWPKLHVYLPQTPLNGSITPTMMEAFIELQKAIYRTQSLASSNNGDLRTMTKLERERLEFRVKVSDGSSEYLADLAKSSQAIVASLVGKMTPHEVLISVLGTALIVGGSVSWRAWLKSRVDTRLAEIEAQKATSKEQAALEESRIELERRKAELEADTEKYTLLVQAMHRMPVLGDVEDIADASKSFLVRAVGDEQGGKIQDISFDQPFAYNVTSTRRQQSVEKTFTGVYRVAKVDATSPDGFRVTLSDIGSEQEVTASLQDAFISDEHRMLIRDAEWKKTPIRVKILAKQLRNRVIDAVVLEVEHHTTPG